MGRYVIRLLTTLTLAGVCYGQEITIDQVTRAIAEKETGTHWISTGVVKGVWRISKTGDVSPWQLGPRAIADMRLTELQALRIRCSTRAAESAFRQWYSHLLRACAGSHQRAIASYHGGLRGRERRGAVQYAQEVMNLIEKYQQENNHGR